MPRNERAANLAGRLRVRAGQEHAIALADARPDTTCITYLGGVEENEVDSAKVVATTLGNLAAANQASGVLAVSRGVR